MDDANTAGTPAWRAYFADGDSLREAVSRLGLDTVEQRLLIAVIESGDPGLGDLAGALVSTLTQEQLAQAARRSSRTIRKRSAIERLAPFVERLPRPGTTDVLVCYPDRVADSSGIVGGSATAVEAERERETAQRIERLERAKKRPLPINPSYRPSRLTRRARELWRPSSAWSPAFSNRLSAQRPQAIFGVRRLLRSAAEFRPEPPSSGVPSGRKVRTFWFRPDGRFRPDRPEP